MSNQGIFTTNTTVDTDLEGESHYVSLTAAEAISLAIKADALRVSCSGGTSHTIQ